MIASFSYKYLTKKYLVKRREVAFNLSAIHFAINQNLYINTTNFSLDLLYAENHSTLLAVPGFGLGRMDYAKRCHHLPFCSRRVFKA